MIAAQTKFTDTSQKVLAAKDKGVYKTISHASFSIRKDVLASIKVSKAVRGYFYRKTQKGKNKRRTYYEPSPAGSPVLSHRAGNGFFRRGLQVYVDRGKDEGYIGFAQSVFKDLMAINEHGGTEFGATLEARPTMAPGLKRNIERFHRDWQHSIS